MKSKSGEKANHFAYLKFYLKIKVLPYTLLLFLVVYILCFTLVSSILFFDIGLVESLYLPRVHIYSAIAELVLLIGSIIKVWDESEE